MESLQTKIVKTHAELLKLKNEINGLDSYLDYEFPLEISRKIIENEFESELNSMIGTIEKIKLLLKE